MMDAMALIRLACHVALEQEATAAKGGLSKKPTMDALWRSSRAELHVFIVITGGANTWTPCRGHVEKSPTTLTLSTKPLPRPAEFTSICTTDADLRYGKRNFSAAKPQNIEMTFLGRKTQARRAFIAAGGVHHRSRLPRLRWQSTTPDGKPASAILMAVRSASISI